MKTLRGLLAGIFLLSVLNFARPAGARVLTSTRTVSYTPTSSTSVFTVTYPFLARDHLTVIKTTIATDTDLPLTQNVDYTVTLPIGATQGYVTLTSPIGEDPAVYRLTITRVVPITQLTAFTRQSTFRPQYHEDAFDKLTMIAQQLIAAAGTDGQDAVDTHVGQSDPHAQYFLLAGRSGGQTGIGGTGSGEILWFKTTSHATKGLVKFGSTGTELCVDDVNNRVGVGTCSPTTAFHVSGTTYFDGKTTVDSSTLLGGIYTDADDGTLLLSGSTVLPGNSAAGIIITGPDNASPDVIAFIGDQISLSDETSITSFGLFNSDGFTVGDFRLELDGDLRLTANTAYLSITGSTTAEGSTTAGMRIYGSAHATNANDMILYAEDFLFQDDAGGGQHSTLDDTGFSTSGNIYALDYVTGRHRIIAGGAAYSVNTSTNPTDCGGLVWSGTGGHTTTLPLISADNMGCVVMLVNAGGVDLELAPDSADGIFGSCVGTIGAGAATIAQFTGTANRSVRTVSGNGEDSDYIIVIARQTGAWVTIGCIGEWESEP